MIYFMGYDMSQMVSLQFSAKLTLKPLQCFRVVNRVY